MIIMMTMMLHDGFGFGDDYLCQVLVWEGDGSGFLPVLVGLAETHIGTSVVQAVKGWFDQGWEKYMPI